MTCLVTRITDETFTYSAIYKVYFICHKGRVRTIITMEESHLNLISIYLCTIYSKTFEGELSQRRKWLFTEKLLQ